MDQAEVCCISTDTWTSIQMLGYMAVIVHLVDSDFNLKSHTIAVQNIVGSHTAENLQNELVKVFNDWEILNKVRFSITDNGANVVKACKLLKTSFNVEHFRCSGHVLNLIVKFLFKFVVFCHNPSIKHNYSTLMFMKVSQAQKEKNC